MQYHLGSRTWEPLIDGSIRDSPPPRPYTLIHHILTCCHLHYWNKGLMFYRKSNPWWRVNRKYREGDYAMMEKSLNWSSIREYEEESA